METFTQYISVLSDYIETYSKLCTINKLQYEQHNNPDKYPLGDMRIKCSKIYDSLFEKESKGGEKIVAEESSVKQQTTEENAEQITEENAEKETLSNLVLKMD